MTRAVLFLEIGLCFLSSLLGAPSAWSAARPVITVGSKTFTESYILAEIISQVIEDTGEARVNRKFGLGGTGIVAQALRTGAIDIYPEYTGTISQAILKTSDSDLKILREKLAAEHLIMSNPLGFNNTYALAVRRTYADRHVLKKISDLLQVPGIRVGFSHEFVTRRDGYRGLESRYDIRLKRITAMAHSLAYEALARGEIDMTDIYSTDPKIRKLGLVVLKDNKDFFPKYFAVFLARRDFALRFPKTWNALRSLEGKISNQEMTKLNAMADLQKVSFQRIATKFLDEHGFHREAAGNPSGSFWSLTRQHVDLVAISLFFSILIGIPLGLLAARYSALGQVILTISGLLQTIPSLALLCFLIPVFGIGTLPALVALFLYGLLPIVTGVHIGVTGIDPRLSESANALGLKSFQRLWLIDLPLASRSILAGIKTSAIIGIGTATLAALIGAGGYGTPIVTGLAMNDMRMILSGAIPAAGLALLVHAGFEGLNRIVIPRGLRR